MAKPAVDVPKGNGKITGMVVDAAGKPIEFANIALFNTATNQPVNGTMALIC